MFPFYKSKTFLITRKKIQLARLSTLSIKLNQRIMLDTGSVSVKLKFKIFPAISTS